VKNWSGACQVAAVYVGTVVGAGFATGKEIMAFFTRFGLFGLLSILIAGLLFIILGTKMMLLSIDMKANSFEQLSVYLFGKRLAKIVNILLLAMLVGVCAVMLSGAEALFAEQLHFPAFIGMLATIACGLAVTAAGVKGLFAVNVIVVPMMIFFNAAILFDVFSAGGFHELLKTEGGGDGWRAVLSAFSYAGFNLALAQAVLVPLAAEIKDRQTVKRGGVMGGAFLTMLLISGHLCLSALDDPGAYDIPMAVIVLQSAGSLYVSYVILIYGEIFTTLIGNAYGLERQLQRYVQVPRMALVLLLYMAIFFISLVKYGTLLAFLYPLFGYMSMIFLLMLVFKPGKKTA
jgi:uncharacterized membrane protein YkvI